MKCYFFGTFNPIHKGHIEIARKVKEIKGFSDIIFVPSFMPPHKVYDLANYTHRLKMAELAVGKENVSDIEHTLKIPSYTYRTIEKLYTENNNEKINFIIGYDQFLQIESWKEPEVLKEKLNFIVIPRKFQNRQIINKQAFEFLRNRGFSYEILDIDFLDISSEMIRKSIANNMDIAGLVSREVREYIEDNNLYRKLAQTKFVR